MCFSLSCWGKAISIGNALIAKLALYTGTCRLPVTSKLSLSFSSIDGVAELPHGHLRHSPHSYRLSIITIHVVYLSGPWLDCDCTDGEQASGGDCGYGMNQSLTTTTSFEYGCPYL